MAQTGFTPISNYYSATATNVPTAGNLVAGELAINTADGKLFYKDSSGVVQTMASKDTTAGTYSSITTSNLTIGTTQLGAGNASIMKNRIINGAMVVAQRTTASINVDNSAVQYPVDRFFCYGSQASSKFSVQQTGVTLNGFTTSIKATSSSAYSVASGDNFYICQNIEGYNVADLNWGTANAKTVTLSFQVYSSLTGTFGGALLNDGYSLSYPFSYSIPVANTWTTISVTIAGPTTSTWLTNNGVGIRAYFSLGTGTTGSSTAGSWQAGTYYSATGATSVVGTNGATFYITGVQLEVGSSATGYDYRVYGTELMNCQRYYWKVVPDGGTICGFGSGQFANLTTANIIFNHPVTMRTAPTLAYGGTYNINGGASAYAVSAVTTYASSTSGRADFTVSGAIAGSGAAGWLPNASTNFITASAEL